MKLSRELYKTIKGFNKDQMEEYLRQLYKAGVNDGVETLRSQVVSKIDKGLRNTPGIGEKRYTQIMENINKEFNS